MEKRNYRINEFSARYGVGRTKVYEEIKAGRLKALKFGKSTLIPVEAAEEWQSFLEPLTSHKEVNNDGIRND